MQMPCDEYSRQDRRGNCSGPEVYRPDTIDSWPLSSELEQTKAILDLLREKEELLGTIINSIPSPLFYKDTDGRYTGCNDAFCSFVGYSREQIIGSTVYDLAPGKLAGVYHKADLELMHKGGSQVYEATVRRADDAQREVVFFKSVIAGADGAVQGLVGMFLDVTDQKLIERELRQKEELFHLLFEKSGDANLLIDGTVIIDCNEATVRLLDYPDKQYIVDNNPAALSPEIQPDGRYSVDRANELMLEAYERGSLRFEWLLLRKDGSPLPVEVMLTAIPMHGRWLLHTTWRDLTERKQAEEERERLTQNLLHSQRIESIGRLAGGVAHDFNNLLTPILGYADMLKKTMGSDEGALRKINGILEAGGKARDLTRQLLAFGRKQVLDTRVVDLNEIIDSFTSILERTIREDIHISLKLAPHLSGIMADRSQIEQIILNLAINARDAMPSGGSLLIRTDTVHMDKSLQIPPELPPGLYVKLEVSDTGCGMERDTLDQIFEPFFTTKEPGNGTGLGLSTVFGIVKQHGGHITAYSEPGHGSSFSLYFPALEGPPPEETKREEPAPLTGIQQDAYILLVEDNEMVREMTADLLTNEGYRVLVATDPAQALAIMDVYGESVDLLLSDVIMPGMSGPALFEVLQARKPGLKVLFMSGYNENIIALRSLPGSNSHYIQKPFSARAILSTVYDVLRHQPTMDTSSGET